MDEVISRYGEMLQRLLDAEPMPFNDDLSAILPAEGGVYRISEKLSEGYSTIYIGRTENLRRRIWGDHVKGDRKASTLKHKLIRANIAVDESGVERYLRERCAVQVLVVSDERESSRFEHFAVAVLDPQWND